MRRRRLAVVVTSLAVGLGLGACDTDDGREMREPSDLQRLRLEGTSTTTTSTTTLAPTTAPVLPTPPSTDAAVSVADSAADPTGSAAGLPLGPQSAGSAGGGTTEAAGLRAPWVDGGPIDVAYTCDGEGQTPLIEWDAPPAGTAELALTVVDDDANGYVHWTVVALPAAAGSIGGGAPATAGVEGRNSRSGTGWTPPCPPAGTAHDYRVTLHFLEQQLEEATDAAPSALVAAIEAVSFGEWTVTGSYQRAG